MASTPSSSVPPKPYPEEWESVADLRVMRTIAGDWEKLIGWRNDMTKRGWRLLKVTSDDREIVAVFGKTKVTLHPTKP
jgi:hypothetical protein